MDLTIVIPFCNGHATLGRLLEALPRDVRVIVVDDLSDTPLERPNLNNVEVVRLERKGYFSGAVNAGVARCQGDALVLNQDATLFGGTWRDWLDWRREKFALIGEGVFSHPAWPRGYVQGTFMWIRRDAWQKVGPLNERDYPLWGATAEFQLRLCRAGYQALPVKQSQIPGFAHAVGRTAHTGDSIAELLRREPEKQGWLIRTPPAVSVIIPCYNYAKYLPDAVRSLLGGKTCLGDMPPQTLQSFEVVIVNDGSPDNTREVGLALANEWQGVRYVERPNGGTAAANNTGIAASYGKYFTILSADDMREPWSLETLYRFAEANPGRAVCDDLIVFGLGRRLQVAKMIDETSVDFLLRDNPMHAGAMYSRAAWQAVGGYPEQFGDGREDWAFNLRLAVNGVCALQAHTPGYLYRREGQNRTRLNYAKKAWYVDKLREMYPEIYKGARPMSNCCGHGSARAQTLPAGLPKAMVALAGADGMTLIEYQGDSSGKITYRGAATRTRYVFSHLEPRKWVDSRDVEGFLRMREARAELFKLAPVPPPVGLVDPEVETKLEKLQATTLEAARVEVPTVAVLPETPEAPFEAAVISEPVAFTDTVTAPSDETAGLKPAPAHKGKRHAA